MNLTDLLIYILLNPISLLVIAIFFHWKTKRVSSQLLKWGLRMLSYSALCISLLLTAFIFLINPAVESEYNRTPIEDRN